MVNLSPWRFAFQYSLIIFSVNFKVGLRMNAGGTQLRCLGANDNVTAVTALPNLDFALLEDLGSTGSTVMQYLSCDYLCCSVK